MEKKIEFVTIRLGLDDVSKVDEWRRRELDIPSRSESIRRLIELGVSVPRSSGKQEGGASA